MVYILPFIRATNRTLTRFFVRCRLDDDYFHNNRVTPALTGWLICEIMADVAIAGTMSILLLRRKSTGGNAVCACPSAIFGVRSMND